LEIAANLNEPLDAAASNGFASQTRALLHDQDAASSFFRNSLQTATLLLYVEMSPQKQEKHLCYHNEPASQWQTHKN